MADLRILQLTGTTTGGAGRHAQDLTAGLREAGHRVVLAGPGNVIDQVRAPTARVEVAARPGPGDIAVLRRIRALSQGAQVLHAHGLRAGGLAALALLGRQAPKLVVTLHNKPVGGRAITAVGTVLERLVARRADVVLGVSGDLVQRALSFGAARAERALVPAPFAPGEVPDETGASPEQVRRLRAELDLPPEAPVVLTLARLAPQKGLELLARTAAQVAQRLPGMRWLVAGEGPGRAELADRVAAEQLPVDLLGHRGDGAELLALADVVVSTSSWEGQPLNIQEALRAGRPVVATDVGGTGEVTGSAARLVPYGDPAALAQEISAVLTDPALAEQLGQAARRRARELPTRADTIAQVLRWYQRLVVLE